MNADKTLNLAAAVHELSAFIGVYLRLIDFLFLNFRRA
jgi:hypothetical protein